MSTVHLRRLCAAALVASLFMTAACKPAPSSSSSSQAQKAGASEGGKQRFSFAWPVPCKATVTQRTVKKGTVTVMRYQLVAHEGRGAKIAVTLEDLEFLKVNGRDATSPQMKKQLAPLLAATASMPTLLVSRNGKLADIVGLDAVREKALALIKKREGYKSDDPKYKAIVTMMTSPRVTAQMKKKSADHWKTWVGLWAGVALAKGEKISRMTRLPMPDGTTVDVPLIHHNAGPPKGNPRLVRLEAESVLEGPKARVAMARALQKMSKEMGKEVGKDKPALDASMIEEFKRVSKMSVLTDPATLMPAKAEMRSVSTIRIKGEPRSQQEEVHQYSFAWATSS